MNATTRSRSAGFTLIEVAFACAILSVIATTVYLGERGRLHSTARSFEETAATHLVASRLEWMMADATAPLEPGTTTWTPEPVATQRLADVHAEQSVVQRRPGLFEVTARIQWGTQHARRQSVQLTTLIAREVPR